MISKQEQHAFEIEYMTIGELRSDSKGKWNVNLFNGIEKEKFDTQKEAASFIKRKTSVFQKNKRVGLAVDFKKYGGKDTHLLFPNAKYEEPIEVSYFFWNQIQVNVDKDQKAKRIDQLNPVKVSFNDIARASSYSNPRRIRGMAVGMIIAIAIMIAFLAVMTTFMYAPSDSSKILAIATGAPYKKLSAIVVGSLGIIFAVSAIVVFLIPYYRFYKHAKDETGGFSYSGKPWKKSYIERKAANYISLGLIILSVILGSINNYLISGTMFFDSSIHSIRTWTMIGMLIATDVSIIFVAGSIAGQVASTDQKTKVLLNAHIDPGDIELFKAWTTHKRIESKEYVYDYLEHFTYPPSMERLRIISDVIYKKKLRVGKKVKAEKVKDLHHRYAEGLKIYKRNKRLNKKKLGI